MRFRKRYHGSSCCTTLMKGCYLLRLLRFKWMSGLQCSYSISRKRLLLENSGAFGVGVVGSGLGEYINRMLLVLLR